MNKILINGSFDGEAKKLPALDNVFVKYGIKESCLRRIDEEEN
jgi:hypothetical protein